MDINFFMKTFFNSNNYLEQFTLLNSSSIREEYLGILVYFCFAIILAFNNKNKEAVLNFRTASFY